MVVVLVVVVVVSVSGINSGSDSSNSLLESDFKDFVLYNYLFIIIWPLAS